MKVAIIHYHWLLQAHTVNMAEGFARKGDEVYVFGYDLLDVLSAGQVPQVQYLQWSRWRFFTLIYRIFLKIYKKVQIVRPLLLPFFFLLAWWDRRFFVKKVLQSGFQFDLLLGVEKGGAYFAEGFSRETGTPFLYYSLELYRPGAKIFAWEPLLRVLGFWEPGFTSKAKLVLVQDRERAECLAAYTGVSCAKVYQFPLGVVRQNPASPKSSRKNICICFGNIYTSPDDLLSACDRLPDDWKIVLHNNNPQSWLTAISAHPKIVLSNVQLDEHGIDMLLDSAKVALALYPTDEENNRLIIFSSEKIARYLSRGLPFVINADSNASALLALYKCGVPVKSGNELPAAIEAIMSEYETYVEQSLLAYDNFFDFNGNFDRLYSNLKQEHIV